VHRIRGVGLAGICSGTLFAGSRVASPETVRVSRIPVLASTLQGGGSLRVPYESGTSRSTLRVQGSRKNEGEPGGRPGTSRYPGSLALALGGSWTDYRLPLFGTILVKRVRRVGVSDPSFPCLEFQKWHGDCPDSQNVADSRP